jgi:hypothetical protein
MGIAALSDEANRLKEYNMDRRYERDRHRDERGNWGREWRDDSDRNRESGTYRDSTETSYGRDYGQRDFSDYDENRYLRSGPRSSYGGESDYGSGESRRASPYYGAMTYRDQQPTRRGGYDPYEQSGERWRSSSPQRDFGDRPFRNPGDESPPAYFGTGGYYGGFSGGNTGRDEWGGRFGEGRYRESGIEDDRLGEYRRGESWRGREGGGGLLSRLFKRGPKGYARSDDRIREDISERLYHSAHIDSSEVTVNVQGGKVTLEGTVPNRWMRHAIENEADRCAGVRDIDNNIRVQASDESQTGTSTTSSPGTSTTSGTSRSKLSS